ncbi:MAG: hypothetical protein K6F83_06240 [Clostridiales bacterium]|nr:hypothetical protein [Clostridiales bacterium]
MLIGILTVAGVLFFICAAALIMGKRNIVEHITVGSAVYLTAHVIVSFILFLFDRYDVLSCSMVMLALGFLSAGISILIKRSAKIQVITDIREFIIPLLIVILLVPFSIVKNEYYGLGQDEGGYQTEALMFINGDTSNSHVFGEYYDLAPEFRDEFMADVNDLVGMDSTSSTGDLPVRLVHGIPTYTAFLALWGTVFGYADMQGIMTVFYILSVLLVFLCARNIGLNKISSVLAAVMFGFVPPVIWVSKSALTEGVTALLILLFIYLLTCGKNRLWSIIPVIAFGCFHMSFFAMIPMFIGVYGIYYLVKRDVRDIALAALMPFIGYFSYAAMMVIQPTYTYNNYMKLFRKLLGSDVPDLDLTVIIVLGLYVIMITVFLFILRFTGKTTPEKIASNKIFMIILRVLFVCPILLTGFNLLKNGYPGNRAFLNMALSSTLWQFVVASGIIMTVIASVIFLIRPGKIFENPGMTAVAVMFFYGVLIYSAVINKEITSFYYNTRYMVPYIAISVLFVNSMMKDLNKAVVIPCCAAGLCLFIPANINLLTQRDDTMVDWSTVRDITTLIGENDRVIVAETVERQFWIPVKTISGAKVYPVFTDDLFAEADALTNQNGEVYIINNRPLYEDEQMEELSLVYHDTFTCVGDSHPKTSFITLYPLKFDTYEDEVYIYRYSYKDHREYPIIYSYDSYTGLAGSEHEYAWTGADEVMLNCELFSRDYKMTVDLRDIIPFEKIEGGSLEVEVSANGEYVDTVKIEAGYHNDGFSVWIPKDLLNDGSNVISFRSDLWDASVNNPDDGRKIGFAIENVIFDSEGNT